MNHETINHPTHYQANGHECIDVIEALGWGKDFCVGNALKYLMRAGKKGDEAEDLKKCAWYIARRLEQIERESSES